MKTLMAIICGLSVASCWAGKEVLDDNKTADENNVQVTAQYIEVDLTNVTAAVSGAPDADIILKLLKSGQGRLLSAPTVISRSGVEAVVKGVSEVIYPTTFQSPQVSTNNSNASQDKTIHVSQLNETIIIPEDFATREVGAILNVLPEISPKGDSIHITLKQNYVVLPYWKDYGHGMKLGRNMAPDGIMEQPIFHVYSGESSIAFADGQSIVAGGGLPDQEGKKLVYCVVTVRLVKASK